MTALRAVDAPVITLRDAIVRWQAHLMMARKSRGTVTKYGWVLERVQRELGPDRDVASIGSDWLTEWFLRNWDDAAPATWNRALYAVSSAWAYWAKTGLVPGNIAAEIPHRKVGDPRARDIRRPYIAALTSLPVAPLRERTLWTMLYETSARVHEILNLNIEELDRGALQAVVVRKGGREDTVMWNSATAKLLGAYLKGRASGPVFITTRKAPEGTPLRDRSPQGHGRLSYHQARRLFRQYTAALPGGPFDLHQLRHSRLQHARDAGADDSTLMALAGHRDLASTRRYSRVSAEQLRHFLDTEEKGRARL